MREERSKPGFGLPLMAPHQTFDHLTGTARQAAITATRHAVVAWLSARARSEFPPVEVRFNGATVPAHVTDDAFGLARAERMAAGVPREAFAWLPSLERHMPAALRRDRERLARLEPKATYRSETVARDESARDRAQAAL